MANNACSFFISSKYESKQPGYGTYDPRSFSARLKTYSFKGFEMTEPVGRIGMYCELVVSTGA